MLVVVIKCQTLGGCGGAEDLLLLLINVYIYMINCIFLVVPRAPSFFYLWFLFPFLNI
jgi:hypothetical protein